MPWTLSLFNNFLRDVQPSYLPGTTEFTRDTEQAGGRLRWRPGGGRLEELLTYTFQYDHFENADLSAADSIGNTIDLRTDFRFFPKTALFLDISQGFGHYLNSGNGKFDSAPFRVLAGLQGLVTPKLTTLLAGGYGNGFYDVGPNPSGVVINAELGWLVGPFARGKIGYIHDFANSLYGNYYDNDAGYATWQQQVGTFFLANLSWRLEHRSYHCAPGTQSTAIQCYDATAGPRVDNWMGLQVDAHYFPIAWFSAGAAYQVLTNISDFRIPSGGSAGLDVSFVKQQILAILAVTY
jgi:hypothetical protein